ncbi:MAG: hypothetical protein QM765_44870 [Myxococcales bacterium]
MIAPALSLAAALLCTASGATKVALMPLPAGEGVSDKAAAALTEAITGEIRRVPGVQLITQDEISALLGLERQKSLLGCGDDKCMAEVGGALGVDRLVTGRLSKLGETWMFNLKAMDPKKAQVVAQVDRHGRKASIDDMIELIPTMVSELFGAAPTKGPMRTVDAPKADPAKPAEPAKAEPAPVAPAATATPAKLPPNGLDEPIDPSIKTDDLIVLTDGKGHYLAMPPKYESSDRVFFGDGKVFHQVRKTGGGSNGAGQYSYSVWDPRFRDSFGPDGDIEFFEGAYKVVCGNKKKVETEYKRLPEAEAKKVTKGAKFLKPRFRRQAYAIARDDEGNYFFIDEKRRDDYGQEGDREFHFYMGTKGKMVPYEMKDYSLDSSDEIFMTTAGRLKRPTAPTSTGDGKTPEWIVGKQKTPVSWLALDGQAQLIYTALGVYAGEKLGTPCDPLAK